MSIEVLFQGNIDQLSPQTSPKTEIDARQHEYVAEYPPKEHNHMENFIFWIAKNQAFEIR